MSAPSYGGGQSERNYGEVLAHRRKEVFLAGKTGQRTYDVTVHGDCPNFRGEVRENGTVPLGGKGTGTFFGPKRPEK